MSQITIQQIRKHLGADEIAAAHARGVCVALNAKGQFVLRTPHQSKAAALIEIDSFDWFITPSSIEAADHVRRLLAA